MASERTPAWDDLEPVDTPASDDEQRETISLDPGEHIVGELREVRENVGKYDNTVLVIARGLGDVVEMWSNRSIDRQLTGAELGPGDVIGIRKAAEPETYTDDDGQEQQFYPFEVREMGTGGRRGDRR